MSRSPVALVFVLAACTGKTDADAPTYYKDVRPVLDQHCMSCHTDEGVAPFSMATLENVRAVGALIPAQVTSGSMPPPAPDPACADYVDSERFFLSDAEIQTLVDWVDADMPEGDEADAPEPPEPFTTAPFDLEIFGESNYTPSFPDGPNDYRCWEVDLANEDDLWVSGFEALPGVVKQTHHVVLFLDPGGASDPGTADGFPCDGLGQDDWEILAAWGPGASPLMFPEGAALSIPDHARVVVQTHFFDNGEPQPDLTGYGLHLVDTHSTAVYMLPAGVERFEIPAGAADHQEEYELDWPGMYGTMTMYAIWPHMHVLGSGFDVEIDRSDGTKQCAVDMNGWSFHNQTMIQLKEPIQVRGGDTYRLTCHWDNSAENPNQLNDPPIDIEYGEGTNNEMCFGFTYASFGF